MAEVTYLHAMTAQAIPVARVLDGAQGCTDVLVLGATPEGALYAAASTGDVALLLWWMEQFRYALLSGEYA